MWLLEFFLVILKTELYFKNAMLVHLTSFHATTGIVGQHFPVLSISSAQQKAEPIQDSVATLGFFVTSGLL